MLKVFGERNVVPGYIFLDIVLGYACFVKFDIDCPCGVVNLWKVA